MNTMAIDTKIMMMTRALTIPLLRKERKGMELMLPTEGSLPWLKKAVKIRPMKSLRKMVIFS
jgi:hypothetical protein